MELLCKHEIRNIHCACQGGDDLKDFAYITKDIKKAAYFCHVFSAKTLVSYFNYNYCSFIFTLLLLCFSFIGLIK